MKYIKKPNNMKNKIKYILMKLVQITAIAYLPILLYNMWIGPFSITNTFWFGIDFAVLIYYIDQLLSKELEGRISRSIRSTMNGKK